MTVVERRRFRGKPRQQGGRPKQQVLFRAHAQRFFASWSTVTALTACLGIALLVPAFISYQARLLGVYDGYDGFGLASLLGLLVGGVLVMAILAVVVGAPLVAEDRRTRAMTFFFSGPLRAGTYMRSKLVALAVPTVVLGVFPAVITVALIPVYGWPATPAAFRTGQRVGPADASQWSTLTINGTAEWLFALGFVALGLLLVAAFLVTLTLLASVYTRRAWHAGFVLVAGLGGLGALGLLAGQAVGNAFTYAFGPFGWMYAATALPLEMMLRPAALDGAPGFAGGWLMWGLGSAMLAGLSLVAWLLCLRRIRKWEAPQ